MLKRIPLAILLGSALTLLVPAVQAGAIHDAGLFTTSLPANDDGSTGSVALGFTANFFGTSYTNLFVNNNGNVTFDVPLGTFTPFPLLTTAHPMLAPFFGDVDTRVGPTVHYGTGVIATRPVFGVNWIDVGYFANHLDKRNSFQLIITDRSDIGAGDFDFEFNYDKLQWETGDASSGVGGLGGSSARAGWSNGVSTSFEFPGSAIDGSLLDTNPAGLIYDSRLSSIDGQYIFQVRNGSVEPPPPAIPEPGTVGLLAAGLAGLRALRRKQA